MYGSPVLFTFNHSATTSGGTRCASGSIGHRQIDNDANKPTNIYLSTCANRKYADDDRCESRLTKILSSTFLLVTVLDFHKPVVVKNQAILALIYFIYHKLNHQCVSFFGIFELIFRSNALTKCRDVERCFTFDASFSCKS
ncbi:hypothetical protein T02_473 [Trichinella nativa]|uniref:Uncharacterized protein n=1 Tax=Trichinella nativa TaxID=6335 RepID=A0A0V1KU35_9BILA|nr:hypothetical protein T02_473 [Trichinella nativa]